MATKRAAAKNSRKTAKRSASARSRKPAGGISARSRRKPANESRPRHSSEFTFMGMLADIFGMRRDAR